MSIEVLGRYIVADPEDLSRQAHLSRIRESWSPMYRNQVARGLDWQTIVENWGGDINDEAIADAVRAARAALLGRALQNVRP